MQPQAAESEARLDLIFIPALLIAGFFIAVYIAAKSPDWRMVMQAWTFLACVRGNRRLVPAPLRQGRSPATSGAPMRTTW